MRWRWRLLPKNCPTAFIAWARCRISAAARTPRWPGLLGLYAFDRYKKPENAPPETGAARRRGWRGDFSRIAEGVFLARDLINTPPNDMGPAELADAARRAGANAWRQIPHRRAAWR